jgi:transcriptional regulator GlxA family with amidase domain
MEGIRHMGTVWAFRELHPRDAATVKKYVDENLDGKLSLQHLGALLGLKRNNFGQRFAQTFGETKQRYLITVRTARALQLLRDTDMPLAQIACTVGFNSQAHLNQHVRRTVGMTPGQYRARRKELTCTTF